NVPFGALGLVWGMIILRALPTRTSGEKVDLVGGGLVFVALGGLIVAATQLGAAGKVGPVVWAGLAAFVLAAGAFLWTERRSASPMIDFGLFRDRAFALAYVATFLNSFARSAVVLLTALFLQVTQQENAFHAGLKVVPVTVGMLLASPVAGALTGRYPVRSLASAGLVGVAVGLVILLLAMTPGAPYGWVGCGLFLVGFGSGFFLTPNTTAIMTAVPPYRRGMANGLRSMLNNMGQVLSAALMLMVVTMPLPPRLKDAVYLGAAAQVSGSDIAEIAGGFRLAFGVLILVTLGALVASVLRGPSARSELGGHPDRDVRVEAGR
ncbi:MAG: MFS transporter, partial [Alicyclobacillaceae bacterium]|nr:MFS transporter [Alicyclobacillaceae bacterium]